MELELAQDILMAKTHYFVGMIYYHWSAEKFAEQLTGE
jgi:hypothetical protein